MDHESQLNRTALARRNRSIDLSLKLRGWDPVREALVPTWSGLIHIELTINQLQ